LLRSTTDLLTLFRIELFAIVLLGVAALTAGISDAPLVNWDEATYAEVAHEAVGSGSFLRFTCNGDPYLKKPPLLFWMVIGSFKTFGESAWAARLPSVLAGVGTMLLLYFSAAAVAGRLGGVFAGLLPLGFYFFIARGGRECATDGPLVFFSTLALFALTRVPTNRRWLPVVGIASGLAILTKGLAGVLPLGVSTLTILLVPNFGPIGVVGLILIFGLALAVVAPWLIYELICNGPLFWKVFVKQETVFRVATHLELHRQTGAATLPTFLREVGYLWVVALPLGGLLVAAMKRGSCLSLRQVPPAVMVWVFWLVLGLAAACAVQTKLGWYVLPALPPVALLCGSILGVALRRNPLSDDYTPKLAAIALAVLAVETPARWEFIDHAFRVERERSRPSYMLGMRARIIGAMHGDEELLFVGVELPTLVYYSGMRSQFATLSAPEFPDLAYHQVVLREPDGAFSTVGNLDDEWNLSGPANERGSTDVAGGVCQSMSADARSIDGRFRLLANRF
jgi:4-amino-4-deoxy-L-arabinose transferase-like glycosyltransferase